MKEDNESWMEITTNEEILQMVEGKRSLIGIILSRPRKWFNHITRQAPL